jgi:thiol:disulfide interchange protein
MTKTTSILGIITLISAIVLLGVYWYKTTDNLSKDDPKQQEEWSDWELNERLPELKEPKKEEVPDVPKTYKQALEIAKKTNQPIFLLFRADWCHWCGELKKTLDDPEVKNALNGYIIYYANSDVETDLADQYKVSGIPAYFVISSSEKILKDGKGYKEAKVFLAWLK